MNHERIEIPLPNLILNLNNDRHGEMDSEHECISWMLEHIGDEIINLAKDIAEHGLSPLDGILVMPDEEVSGDYIVREGNRRITALKLLDDPNRTLNKSYRQKFTKIRKESLVEIPTQIECTVATSDEEAERLIELRHQGPQKGIGTVPWSPSQKSRHQQRLGKTGRYAFSQTIIDAFADKLDPDLRERINAPGFAISTLDRLLQNHTVREFLGITSEEGVPRRLLRREETIKGLQRILSDIADGMSVSEVYTSKLQQTYLDSFEEQERPDHEEALKDSKPIKPAKAPAPDKAKTKKKTHKKHPHERNRLIPGDFKLSIDDARLNKIYWELRQLELPRFCNAASVLLRVFLELSTDSYLRAQKISHEPKANLTTKIQLTTKHLKSKDWLDDQEAKGINTAISAKDSPFSINSFHGYVHNKHLNPSKEYLIDGWDNMAPYFEAVLDHL